MAERSNECKEVNAPKENNKDWNSRIQNNKKAAKDRMEMIAALLLCMAVLRTMSNCIELVCGGTIVSSNLE